MEIERERKILISSTVGKNKHIYTTTLPTTHHHKRTIDYYVYIKNNIENWKFLFNKPNIKHNKKIYVAINIRKYLNIYNDTTIS